MKLNLKTNKQKKTGEMDKLLESHEVLKLIQEKTENLNTSITSKEIDLI